MTPYISPGVKTVDPDFIRKVVCEQTGVSERDLYHKCRLEEVVYTRYLIYYFLHLVNPKYDEPGHLTLNKMGAIYFQDHTTVVHGIKRINNEMYDSRIKNDVETIKKKLFIK